MRIMVTIAAGVVATALAGAYQPAHAAPMKVRVYCAVHKDYGGPGEQSQDELPPAVRAAGASYWRCMGGKPMVCYGGATGFACAKTVKMDAERMHDFKEFCAEQPGNSFIPNSMTVGLASEWRCAGTTPTIIKSTPVDRLGYKKGNWRPLP